MIDLVEPDPLEPRLRAVADLSVAGARGGRGLHAYDGVVQDLSPDGVARGLAALGGPPRDDPHDEAALAATEAARRLMYGELAVHRSQPGVHLAALDLSDYDRPGIDPAHRAAARARHLAAWPDAVDAACAALDAVQAPVAEAMLGSTTGIAAPIAPDEPGAAAALSAHQRLVAHLQRCAADGPADAALGGDVLARLYGVPEATTVDLGTLATTADAEIARLQELLADACRTLHPGRSLPEAAAALLADKPSAAQVLHEARALTEEVQRWTRSSGLFPDHDGTCEVGPAPPSKAHVTAMLEPAGPFAPDGSSRFLVTPPGADWPPADVQAWLEIFNRTSLPAIAVHEVAPGHHLHFRLMRQVRSPVRKLVLSTAFVEGWAHDVEELALEEGFRAGDPRYAAGVAIEALIRAVRLAVSIGVHTGAMTVAEAAERFTAQAFLRRSAARSEALRATFDPTYGRYTWGKLAIRAVRDRARQQWGSAYRHRGFHTALLALGAPPLGLMDGALDAPGGHA